MRIIFVSILLSVLAMLMLTGAKCNKDPLKTEENLRISTDAPGYSETPGPDFNFNLTVESAMPSAGIKISFVVKGEIDNMNYPQGPAIETSNKITRIGLANLPRQKICVCTITVTSKGSNSNSAVTNFRIVYK